MRDISGSLARQAMLVAALCLVADASMFLIRGPSLSQGWPVWVVLLGGIVVNTALAGPARYAGWVSLAHAVMLITAAVLLCPCTGFVLGNNSGILVAGFRSGAWLRTTPAILALLAMVTGSITSDAIGGGRTGHNLLLMLLGASVTSLLPWLVGRYTTARRAYIADLELEAEQRRLHEAEAVRRAVTEERTTIARDLHDVISHHVSAIGVHAGAARLGLPDDGDAPVRRSLTAVETASRSAMVDLRRLLDLLHGTESTGAQRQPGLDNVDELLEGIRAAGRPARLTTHGTPHELSGSLDVALYRIVQESLTNALRHGDSGTVEVELDYRETEIVLSVTNESIPGGRGSAAEFPHRGLAGIRQRVALFGGRVDHGHLPDGQHWRVRAIFPLEST
ncbi:sensor histidine kinase [Amycolatopsis sp. H20-H5]|uniref:sensor histidine kinase n=1 Tax=Amycolatopsis sp. H20-H5 TaxID=3046309 RepID=UPI002DB7F765|nr:histidine kinase [Amycolatopsis sp. H20-H5]MEC3975154.1 histidine kinase [Amycolatopsis sp. H20-H5]